LGSKEKALVTYVEDDASSDEDVGVCLAKWVDGGRDKPLACAFLKPNPRKREEMKFTFDVIKCDKLFDVLLQNNVIHLSEEHIVPPVGQPVKGNYCKWHGTFSSTSAIGYQQRPIDIRRRLQDEAGFKSFPSERQHDGF
jgi:hypothetical protein